ncbi:alpha,alpha-phosphotrehalase [Clostridium beijerinckii]|uniref:Alpha,alpha-phosphotrehalase n=1 Tax=Clostridium beijerinckii TaxID=1520 RepID=A0A9Q5GJS3_CLOBE|nr:alpha,alpha-phosphotrehalase [Clostridium beijerinckii]AQS05057.1 trehalose-6-phosphate hydrolase [Clostridium beijerinckii]MBA2886047.1 trehalose-6-phosphate hydrolase [Clostridium beijerinckii]MBA2900665.1 trehalose-6-phosphate hydrolase [Clostridium beijerinckii]MBA2910606.1 trehalose-6-phosphate hydrolase [Clostridium beijerinckii]MBA9015373.1 trehalose-6-phosphate hydrolase [Clostridium beijerinckii]
MKDFKKSTIYQIYPKSFYDTNGDGIGDLNGVIEKLDYLKNLGIDYIWLTPFYPSPQVDNGYDISDYYNIDPSFGTLEDFEKLVQEAEKRDIYVMLDMVLNHTSTEHEWFKKAISGDRKYKDFYIFKESEKDKPPTNWESKFGGNAWEYVEKFDEYYLHLFDRTQADLNWDNEKVRNEIYGVVNFWLKKGVKGLRFDVINLISKPEKFESDSEGDGRRFYTDGPKIHDYLHELNENTYGKYEDIITVGEMSSTSLENCIRYSNPEEKELSMVFNFHHLKVDYYKGDKWTVMDFDFMKLKALFKTWQEEIQNGWNALFWCNHDQPRIVSRFGNDKEYLKESAKMLATTIHMMRGTPYVYQGEEIGMTNPYFDKIEKYRDVESINYYNILKEQGKSEEEILQILKAKSRDNSRTPVQWDDSENAGFTKGESWIPVSSEYKRINVEQALKDEDSIFYHYQKLIRLRKDYEVISNGSIKFILEENNKVLSYVRNLGDATVLVINNFYGESAKVEIPDEYADKSAKSKILISNYKDSSVLNKELNLRPFESIVYHI